MASNDIPDPPLLPPGIEPKDCIVRLNHFKGQFDVYARKDNHERWIGPLFQLDQIMTGLEDRQLDLKLGPPSQSPDWHPLLDVWGLQVMEAAGFLNSNVYPGRIQWLIGRLASYAHSEHPIHPVLREDMWNGMDADLYRLMRPALHLASAILDDPETLRFFAGLATPKSQMQWVDKKNVGKCPIYKAKDTLSGDEIVEVYGMVTAMRNHIVWQLESAEDMYIEDVTFGITRPMVDKDGEWIQGARPDSRKSYITISMTYLHIIASYGNPDLTGDHFARYINDTQFIAGIRLEDTVHLDPASAMFRSVLLLADTLVHEFAHAFSAAYFGRSVLDETKPAARLKLSDYVYEPFYEGDRCNEVGHAISSYVFRGNPKAMFQWTPPQSHSSSLVQQHFGPFGLCWSDKWDKWFTERVIPSARKKFLTKVDYNTPELIYPIPQVHINKLFSGQLWQSDIHRFGLGALRFPKLDKWAVRFHRQRRGVRKGYWSTGIDKWGLTPPPADDVDDEGGVKLY